MLMGETGRKMADRASASDGTAVSGSVKERQRVPSKVFGYTFLGNAKRC